MSGGRRSIVWDTASSATLAKLLRRSALARLTRPSAQAQRRSATPHDVVEAQDEAAHSLRWLMEEFHSRPDIGRSQGIQHFMVPSVRRLAKGEPLAYVLGHTPFGPIEKLICRQPTLIPRPETEEWSMRLADVIIDKLKHYKGSYRLLDMCTGTGCIALLLATRLKETPSVISVTAADIHPTALSLAKENGALLNLSPTSSPNVNIQRCDIFSDSDLASISSVEGKFDLLVCNPPYIASPDWQRLDSSVTEWEDRGALVGDTISIDQAKGLAFYERIAALVSEGRLIKTLGLNLPSVVLEVGKGQAETVKELLRRAGILKTEVWKDAWGIERTVLGWSEQ